MTLVLSAFERRREPATPTTRVHLFSSTTDLAGALASRVAATLVASAAPVLGVATGSTPQPTYAALAENLAFVKLAKVGLRVVALDEYIGLECRHPQRFGNVLKRDVIEAFGLENSRLFMPRASVRDGTEAAMFEAQLSELGGVDVQILGIGVNGHVGFNEPGSHPLSITRVVSLAPETRAANARFFSSDQDVPTHAVTQGISTIMRAKRIALIATGSSKAAAVKRALMDPPTRDTPASLLQGHPRLDLYLDAGAASQLDVDELSRSARIIGGT